LPDVLTRLTSSAQACVDWFSDNLMRANPDKFQLIVLSRRPDNSDVLVNLNGIEIRPVEHVKLLGVTIDAKLNFHDHVNMLCKKASRNVKILLRLSKRLGEEKYKRNLFESFVLSCFTYCTIVWHFSGKSVSRKLEKIYERGLRFITGDYLSDYATLLQNCNRNTFVLCRIKKIALFVFNCYSNNLQNFSDMYTSRDNGYSLRNENKIFIHRFNTVTYGKMSLKYSGSNCGILCHCYGEMLSTLNNSNVLCIHGNVPTLNVRDARTSCFTSQNEVQKSKLIGIILFSVALG